MHETGLVRDLVAKISALVQENGARRVRVVRVWLGAMCHMDAVHFREHFEREAAGTPVQGARIEAEENRDPFHPQAYGVVLKSIDVE